jgi:hypothetical protein
MVHLPWYCHHGLTSVKCTMVFGVVHLHYGYQLYHDILWYKCTTPKAMVHFTMIRSAVVGWLNFWVLHGPSTHIGP